MKIVEMGVTEIFPYENNPRINEAAVEYVAESIREFGFRVPIVIDENNIIIAGHTRLKAAQKLGMERVPCIQANDLTEDQVRAFRLADNKVAEFSTWDMARLEEELDGLNYFGMDRFGFSPAESKALDDLSMDDEPEAEEPEKTRGCKCPMCGCEFEE